MFERMHIAQLWTDAPFCHHGEDVRFAGDKLKTAVFKKHRGVEVEISRA
jgi:hypothetical protein